ncbi:glycoside hydrolase [Coemansia reversa NRRL 1564]|uniref:glucan endo-1,3-beta-D-glucosidase n=1 Tax=Coemansia reversa (strain ATCC 12441 / NRRL 1564) TaxID=763665 RepID=A0A2G5B8C1_COERN|nr:glycoside hydrolase [Coemansia reversa NRRL 1564]|eukprot:PIA15249.1 glycoside hydrolase [Coemansia reversa NRRL 1564]
MIKCVDDSVVVCAPTALNQQNFVASIWHDDWKLSLPGSQRKVVAFDNLSVTVGYTGSITARVPLVKGSVFATILIETPAVVGLTTIHAITSIDTSRGSGVSIVQLNNGTTWFVYCESGAAAQQSGMSGLTFADSVHGAVRLALVNNGDQAIKALSSAKDTVPIGGEVSIQTSEDSADFSINWKVRDGDNSDALLMSALPHHQHALTNAQWVDSAGEFWSSKGNMRMILGSHWNWREEIEPLEFTGQTPLTETHKDNLLTLVKADANALPADTGALPPDPYFFGKALARAARIALIADEVGDIGSRDLALQRAIAWLEPWLAGTNSNYLIYDTEWSGYCTQAGLTDPGADFGQGRYNDHHFHYGYFVYAAAVISKLNPDWSKSRLDALDLFVRDYCNPSAEDSAFPFMRHFDFFEGHSWAAGLFAFADSRNQESTSEAINSYYASYLYALATGRDDIANYVRAVLQLEARATRTYWHIGDITSDIYPDVYSNNKAIVGILWSSKIDFATFFGANPEFIYGIQFMPYVPATALILKKAWIEAIWSKYLLAVADGAQSDPWREIIDLAYAVVGKEDTLARISRITSHDDGNSASNSYYWVATAPIE